MPPSGCTRTASVLALDAAVVGAWKRAWGISRKTDGNFSVTRLAMPLAGADDVERHAAPAPVVHEALHRHVGLHAGLRRDVGLLAVRRDLVAPDDAAPVLAAHDAPGHVAALHGGAGSAAP